MNFAEAVATGKKVRSVNWEKGQQLDTSIFSEQMESTMIPLFARIATPLSWNDILNKWELAE